MIHVHRVSKFYQAIKAVDDISFDVQSGETLVLLGPSGCGKTTTLRMLNRLTEPNAGLIELDGENISARDPEKLRRGIGYVLQHHGLFPHYTVAENIAIVPRLLKWDQPRIAKRSKELLLKLHLDPEEYLQSYPAQLSGGQQQRVGLARALMADPPVLLMDEPLGALDPVTRANIRKEFNQLDELTNKTIVLVTHDVLEAFELADRICLMNRGRIVQIGTPYQLLFEPENDFVKGFFADQRLQLELKTLRINDLWALISFRDDQETGRILSSEIDIWEALEALLRSDRNTIRIHHSTTGEHKSCGYKELMTAYSDFKSTHP